MEYIEIARQNIAILTILCLTLIALSWYLLPNRKNGDVGPALLAIMLAFFLLYQIQRLMTNIEEEARRQYPVATQR